jgi:hypothetical protein
VSQEKEPTHTCEGGNSFAEAATNPSIPFYFVAEQEAWGVPTITDDSLPVGWWNDAPLHKASFCPWCGQPLP